MLRGLQGVAKFISAERGVMVFAIAVGAAFLMLDSRVESSAIPRSHRVPRMEWS